MEISGNLIFVQIGATSIVGLISKDLDFTADTFETTNQQSTGLWKVFGVATKGGSISVQGVYSSGEANGASGAFNNLSDGAAVTWKYGQLSTGQQYYTGSGLITALKISGPMTDAASYSFDITVSGPPSKSTN